MPSESPIAALLAAVDDADHLAGCECLLMYPRECSCNLRELTAAAAAVREALARPGLSDEELHAAFHSGMDGDMNSTTTDGFRAIASAVRERMGLPQQPPGE